MEQGGSIQINYGAGNNYPLRGGKLTDFEGGIRAVTVVNGGYLPDARRGQVERGMMHIADWYDSLCFIEIYRFRCPCFSFISLLSESLNHRQSEH